MNLPSNCVFSQKGIEDSLKSIAAEADSDTARIIAWIELSVYHFSQDADEGMKWAQKALKASQKIGNNHLEAKSLIRVGNCYHYLGDFPTTLDYYLKALNILENSPWKKTYAQALGNIATLFDVQNNPEKALEVHLKTLEIVREINDQNFEAGVLINIANSYFSKGDYNLSQKYADKAYQLAYQLNNKKVFLYSFNMFSLISEKQGDYDQAIEWQKKIIENADSSDLFLLTNHFINLANLYRLKKNYQMSFKYGRNAEDVSGRLKSINLQSKAANTLFRTAIVSGDSILAMKYHLKFSSFKDSAFNIEKSKQLSELTFRYERQKAEKEKERLQLINKIAIFTVIAFSIFVFIQFYLLWKMKLANRSLVKKNLELIEAQDNKNINYSPDDILKGEQVKNTPPEAPLSESMHTFWQHPEILKNTDKDYKRANTAIDTLFFRLENEMKIHKWFKDKSLTLDSLAQLLGTNRTYLSQAINTHHKCSFNHYINQLRINEFIRIITCRKRGSYTIAQVASEVGFSSSTPFREAFKLQTGLTPGVFINNLV